MQSQKQQKSRQSACQLPAPNWIWLLMEYDGKNTISCSGFSACSADFRRQRYCFSLICTKFILVHFHLPFSGGKRVGTKKEQTYSWSAPLLQVFLRLLRHETLPDSILLFHTPLRPQVEDGIVQRVVLGIAVDERIAYHPRGLYHGI